MLLGALFYFVPVVIPALIGAVLLIIALSPGQ